MRKPTRRATRGIIASLALDIVSLVAEAGGSVHVTKIRVDMFTLHPERPSLNRIERAITLLCESGVLCCNGQWSSYRSFAPERVV